MKVMIFAVVSLLMLSVTSSAFSFGGEFSQVKDRDIAAINNVGTFGEPDFSTSLKKEKLIAGERTDDRDNLSGEVYLRPGSEVFCPPLSLSSVPSSFYCVRAE